MTKRWSRLLLGLAIALESPAVAFGALNGNELFQACTSSDGSFSKGQCVGYVQGVGEVGEVEGIAAANDAKTTLSENRGTVMGWVFCTPSKATVRQAVDVVVKFLWDNPARRHFPATVLVARALQEAWPCPATR
jgi:hypothetical protein